MNNVVCSNCGASFGGEIEFCDSCGEWQGVSPIIDGEAKKKNTAKRITTLTSEQLSGPISTYESPTIPTRTQFPGVRAVLFILVIVPLIAVASYWYNREVATDVVDLIVEEQESNVATTSSSVATTIPPATQVTQILSKFISNCSTSSDYGEGYSCSNLYDGQKNSWQDNSQSCKDGYIIFSFDKPVYIKFITFQNLEDNSKFIRNWKVRELRYSTPDPEYYYTEELVNDNAPQWVEMEDTTTEELKIEFLSAYPGEEYNGSPAFEECAIQEVEIFGYPNSDNG